MANITEALTALRRPKLLIQAARLGLDSYNRSRMLARLLPSGMSPAPGDALQSLMEVEAALDADRRNGAASYSIGRHIELLSALMAEARLLSRAT